MREQVYHYFQSFWHSPAQMRLTFLAGGLVAIALVVALFLCFKFLRWLWRGITQPSDKYTRAFFEVDRVFGELKQRADSGKDEEAAREFLRRKVYFGSYSDILRFYIETVVPRYPRLVLEVPQQLELASTLASHGEPAIALHAYENLLALEANFPEMETVYLEAANLCRLVPGREADAELYVKRHDEIISQVRSKSPEVSDLALETPHLASSEPTANLTETSAPDWRVRLPQIENSTATIMATQTSSSRLRKLQPRRLLNRKQKSSTRRQKESAKIEIEESLAPPNEETGAVQDNFYRDSTVPLNSFDVPPISRNVAQSENPEGTNGQTAHESSTEPHFMAVFESADMPLSRDLPPQLVSKIKPLESVMKDDVLVQDVSEREINQLQELFSDTSMVKFPSSDPIISEEPADVTGIELNAEEIVIIGRAGAERIRYEDVKIASLAYSKLSSRSVNFKTCLEIINTEHRRYQAWDRTLLHGSTSIDGTLVESDKPLHDIYNALIPRISKDAIPDWLSERPVNENAIPRLSSFVDYDNYLLALAITALQPPPASSNSANTES